MGEMMYPLKATRSGLKQSKAKEAGGQASSNTMQTGRVWGGGGADDCAERSTNVAGRASPLPSVNDDLGFRLYRKLDTAVS